MGDEWKGANFKQVEDHSKETAELLEKINATTIPVLLRGTTRTLEEYVDEVLSLEKSARLGGDVLSTQKLAVEAIRLYRVQGEHDKMAELLESLMKRRAQTKQVQSAMVAEASVVLQDESITPSVRQQVLQRLTVVTEGKIHVELEHARFSMQLADIIESEGRKREACDILQSLQVETITNMPRLEKLSCLNRQIALCLELGDFLHAPMISRKINHRALSRPDTKEIKLRYFELMRKYYENSEQHLLIARCWYETMQTTDNDDLKLASLSNMVILSLISEHLTAKEVEDAAECTAFSPQTKLSDREAALKTILDMKRVEHELQSIYSIAAAFGSVELIRTRIATELELLCDKHPMLAEKEDRQTHFRNRASEHDLLVVARYYSRVKIERLSQLVGLSQEHTERFIMTLVSNKSIYAKIDRIDGLVVFQRAKQCADVIKQWNEEVEKCVTLVDRAAHLVVKERMLHNLPLVQSN